MNAVEEMMRALDAPDPGGGVREPREPKPREGGGGDAVPIPEKELVPA